MIKKEGKIPVNARIDVDYTSKKPKIKFGYTSKNPKKDALKQTQSYVGFYAFTIFFIVPFIVILIFPTWLNPNPYPSNCSMNFTGSFFSLNSSHSLDYYNGTISYLSLNKSFSEITGAEVYCNTGNYSLYFNQYDEFLFVDSHGFYKSHEGYFKEILTTFLTVLFGGIIISVVIARILSRWLIKQKWYQKWLPKHMAGSKKKKKKYYKYLPKDVLDNVIIIPEFSNVELDYTTKGDFSKQLTKIKIREHRHKKYKRQKVGKLKVNNFRWYAIFYFKEKPKSGYLEVIYQ